MDTIRRKMYLLKIETSDTINRLLSVETEAARNSEAVKEREHRLRQLMKEVLKKENGMIFIYLLSNLNTYLSNAINLTIDK